MLFRRLLVVHLMVGLLSVAGCGSSQQTLPTKEEAAKTPLPPAPKGMQNAKTTSD
jgi:hypothetical protein